MLRYLFLQLGFAAFSIVVSYFFILPTVKERWPRLAKAFLGLVGVGAFLSVSLYFHMTGKHLEDLVNAAVGKFICPYAYTVEECSFRTRDRDRMREAERLKKAAEEKAKLQATLRAARQNEEVELLRILAGDAKKREEREQREAELRAKREAEGKAKREVAMKTKRDAEKQVKREATVKAERERCKSDNPPILCLWKRR